MVPPHTLDLGCGRTRRRKEGRRIGRRELGRKK
jgi:hypothetical protein